MLNNLIKNLEEKISIKTAKNYSKFFKSDKKDIFLGVSIPDQRKIAKKYINLPFPKISKLLDSNIHEYKMVAGIILTYKYKNNPEEVYNFYIKNAQKFDAWDLVDVTCYKILGNFLLEKNKKIIYEFAGSKNIWKRRISIVSTFEFIKNGQLADTLKIAERLLKDKEDLIQKAVGWMLREVGKKNESILKDFLKVNYNKISRITLRYAIEKFPKVKKKKWLKFEF